MENGQVSGVVTLQEKLNDPQVAGVLVRLLDRMDSLEKAVDALATAVQEVPVMMSVVTDAVDDAYAQAAAQGIDLDERVRDTLVLLERLTAPETAAALDKALALAQEAPAMMSMVADMADDAYREAAGRGVDIDARLRAGLAMAEKLTAPETMEALDKALALAQEAPAMMSMVADMADDAYREAAGRGVDIDARLRAGLAMAEKLTAPEMIEQLDKLINMAVQGPDVMSMMADIADDTYREMADNGVDLEERARAGWQMVVKATEPSTMKRLDHMFDTLLMAEEGVLSPEAVAMVGMTARALVAARQQPAQKVGLWGMLTALRDPQLQEAVGFL
ncbi:MAG TPA: DUF1641 domain-containing protein, partial [Anaerolineae bacterium]|nr:DUF1641 domain-containing protein [Anaerolineae bacterium]